MNLGKWLFTTKIPMVFWQPPIKQVNTSVHPHNTHAHTQTYTYFLLLLFDVVVNLTWISKNSEHSNFCSIVYEIVRNVWFQYTNIISCNSIPASKPQNCDLIGFISTLCNTYLNRNDITLDHFLRGIIVLFERELPTVFVFFSNLDALPWSTVIVFEFVSIASTCPILQFS